MGAAEARNTAPQAIWTIPIKISVRREVRIAIPLWR
jgi:hypothetical protein